jgi:hypothetical protein
MLKWYWICEFVIAKLYLQVREEKYYNLANNQASQSMEIKSRKKTIGD